jgi:hypothetical protein
LQDLVFFCIKFEENRGLSNRELNAILARSPEEAKVFDQMDKKKKKYDWIDLDESEALPCFLEQFKPPKKEDIVIPAGVKR